MRVRVVCVYPEADQVLSRFARYLRDGLGWSLGREPSGQAELNYFITYIDYAERFAGWHGTPTAAYFSHRDGGSTPGKGEQWDQAAASVDLRITTAQRYATELHKFGPVVVARPPVERHRFTPRRHVPGRPPVVGVAGVVYKYGRKGEHLVRKLARSDLGRRLEWRASGKKWPVVTRWRRWEEMPMFFRSLDVFLCTSTVEGIPIPVLEALSCGVPVVVPRSIGIVDELPDVAGIHRYRAGDYDDAHRALGETVEGLGGMGQESLRAITDEYTMENWCLDHRQAFEELLYDVKPVKPALPARGGVYVVAFGKPARRCAQRCIASVQQFLPGMPVALASTEPLDAGEDHFVQLPDADIGGRSAKLAAYDAAPQEWRHVLYLDADTELAEDASFLFQLLADGWEFVICKDMARFHTARQMKRPDNREEYETTLDEIGSGSVMQYNGGVVGFRRCGRVKRFFAAWQREWQRWGGRDQGALLRALHANPLRVFVLGNQWNASTRYPRPVGDVVIRHHNMDARRWNGFVQGRLDGTMAWRMVDDWRMRHGDKSPGDLIG